MAAHLLTFVGAVQGSLLWLGVAAVVFGAGRGGGALAWNLGHNDFAAGGEVADYMGLHVTLTGIRGAFSPFLGMALYVGWPARPELGLPGAGGLGAETFLISTAMCAVATLGYLALHRSIQRDAGRIRNPNHALKISEYSGCIDERRRTQLSLDLSSSIGDGNRITSHHRIHECS